MVARKNGGLKTKKSHNKLTVHKNFIQLIIYNLNQKYLYELTVIGQIM